MVFYDNLKTFTKCCGRSRQTPKGFPQFSFFLKARLYEIKILKMSEMKRMKSFTTHKILTRVFLTLVFSLRVFLTLAFSLRVF